MSSHEQNPSTNNSSAAEQTPHSGVHGYEKPVREFDNTTLGEAHDQGLLATPESPALLAPSTTPEKSGRGKKIAAVSAILGVLAAGAGVFAATRGGESAPNPGAKEPAASAPATPGETQVEEKPVEFGISAAEVGNDPEKFAEAYYGEINEYLIAGATEKAANNDRRYDVGMDQYIIEISEPIDEAFINNMFVPEWQENPELAAYVESLKYMANITRRVRINSYAGGIYDGKEAYVREYVLDYAETANGDPNSVTIDGHGYDNRDMNDAEDELIGDVPNTETLHATYTTTVIDGKKLISGISSQ